jgi:acetyl-CoA carboxylase biotin carboxyl carrier protein
MAKAKGSTVVSSQNTSLDVEAFRQLVSILESSEVTEMEWTNGDEKLTIKRGQPVTHIVQQMAPASPSVSVMAPMHQSAPEMKPRASAPTRAPAATTSDKKGHVVTSPFVGTFYRTPSPDQAPYVEVGGQIKKGQVLCIVEAMKLMNEIESEVAGKVTEILVQNATPVEFGQPLFRIE